MNIFSSVFITTFLATALLGLNSNALAKTPKNGTISFESFEWVACGGGAKGASKRAAREAMMKELQQLKTDENYRREFIGNVSHELKTPIFNIQGYVQTLIDGGIEDSDVNMKYLNRANKSVERMINIVEDLEVISKLETDTEELLIEKFNISIVVKEVLEQLEMQANNANISLEFTNESNKACVLDMKNFWNSMNFISILLNLNE